MWRCCEYWEEIIIKDKVARALLDPELISGSGTFDSHWLVNTCFHGGALAISGRFWLSPPAATTRLAVAKASPSRYAIDKSGVTVFS